MTIGSSETHNQRSQRRLDIWSTVKIISRVVGRCLAVCPTKNTKDVNFGEKANPERKCKMRDRSSSKAVPCRSRYLFDLEVLTMSKFDVTNCVRTLKIKAI